MSKQTVPKTTLELITSVEEEIKQLKNQKKKLLQQHSEELRKAKITRNIEHGEILESMISEIENFTNKQITELLKRTVGSSYGAKVITEIKTRDVKSSTVSQSNTLSPNGEAAEPNSAITEKGGGTKQDG